MSKVTEFDSITWQITGAFAGLSRLWSGPWLVDKRTNSAYTKDKAKGNIASNYQPVTYLPLLWKLLTGILVDEIYDYLENVTGRRNEEV